tara:strand:+ start:109 stop:810 length:702 start_codon:yes stop_codon:yes gene_type:complete
MYNKIIDPYNLKFIDIKSVRGKKIIKQYLLNLLAGAAADTSLEVIEVFLNQNITTPNRLNMTNPNRLNMTTMENLEIYHTDRHKIYNFINSDSSTKLKIIYSVVTITTPSEEDITHHCLDISIGIESEVLNFDDLIFILKKLLKKNYTFQLSNEIYSIFKTKSIEEQRTIGIIQDLATYIASKLDCWVIEYDQSNSSENTQSEVLVQAQVPLPFIYLERNASLSTMPGTPPRG